MLKKTKIKPLFKHNKQVNSNSEYVKIWQLKKIHDKNFLEGQIILALCVFCIQFTCKVLYLFLALLTQCDAFSERILGWFDASLTFFPRVTIVVACKAQMYVQRSLLSLRKITEEEKRRPEIRLRFTGYYCGQTLYSVLIWELSCLLVVAENQIPQL